MAREVEGHPCDLETLAQSPVATIQRCRGCGCISVHLGATTLRFEAMALEALWAVLGEAVLHLGTNPLPRVNCLVVPAQA